MARQYFHGAIIQHPGRLSFIVRGFQFCIGIIVVVLVITGLASIQEEGLGVMVIQAKKGVVI